MNTQIIYVEGMTCTGCEQSVKEALEAVEEINRATPNHKTGTVEIVSRKRISDAEITGALPKKYALLNQSSKQPSKLKQLFPLFLIFGFILLSTGLIHYDSLNLNAMMHDFMGLFFMVFSFFKLLDLRGFQRSFKQYDPLAAALPFYGWVYPFLELGLGVCYIRDIVPNGILLATILLLGMTTVGVIRVLMQKRKIQCACLGSVLNLPMTEATFIENAIMLVMAASLLG